MDTVWFSGFIWGLSAGMVVGAVMCLVVCVQQIKKILK